MLAHIIAYIESNFAALNLVEHHYGFAHQIKKEEGEGEKMFPAVYCTGAEYEQIDIDKYNGIFYHRLTGPVTSREETPIDGCGKLITKSFPLRSVICVRKNVLGEVNDDSYLETKVLANMANILNRKASITLLKQTLKAVSVEIVQSSEVTDRYDLWAQEYSGVDFAAKFEYVYAAIDFTVNVKGTPACFEMYGCEPDDPNIIDDFCPSLCARIAAATASQIYACLSVAQIEAIASEVCPVCPPEPTLCEAMDGESGADIVDCLSPAQEAEIEALICSVTTDELTFENASIMGLW